MTRSQFLKSFFVAVLAIVAAGVLSACKKSNGQTNAAASASPAPAVIEITSMAAVSRELPQYFEASGSMAANEQTDVAPETSGKVAAVGVDIGTFVKKGQMLVLHAILEIRVLESHQHLTLLYERADIHTHGGHLACRFRGHIGLLVRRQTATGFEVLRQLSRDCSH